MPPFHTSLYVAKVSSVSEKAYLFSKTRGLNRWSSFSKFGDLRWREVLPNYGIGYRWEFKKKVNVRLDLFHTSLYVAKVSSVSEKAYLFSKNRGLNRWSSLKKMPRDAFFRKSRLSYCKVNPSLKKKVNVRLDLGFGRHQMGFIFNINEAF